MAEIFNAGKVKSIKIENIYKANEMTLNEFALSRLATSDDVLFNTGASALGDPHAGEDAASKGKATVAGAVGPEFVKSHIASLRLFGNNTYVSILPGDSVVVKIDGTLDATAQVAYYLDQATAFGFLKVTLCSDAEGATEISNAAAAAAKVVNTEDGQSDSSEDATE